MNLLLDTHTLLWFLWDDPQLSDTARRLIVDSAKRKLVSVASIWEISIKAGVGKLNLGEVAATFLERELTQNHFEILPITLIHATGVEPLPHFHRDPFDRLLISQALSERLPVVSADVVFDEYGVERVW